MKRKLVALMALLASLSLAQTPPNTDSHTITVKVPPVLRLSLDATEYLFDFTVGTSVANNSLGFPKATKAAYEAFLDDESKTKLSLPLPALLLLILVSPTTTAPCESIQTRLNGWSRFIALRATLKLLCPTTV
jgi:hypothetical protein